MALTNVSAAEEVFYRPPVAMRYMLRSLFPSTSWDPTTGFPDIRECWREVRVDQRHLQAFLRLTGLKATDAATAVLYPQVLSFRLLMALLTNRAFPLPIWRSLQIRNHLVSYRALPADEALDIQTRVVAQRILRKGAEVDLHTSIESHRHLVWESLNTFYYRGHFGEPAASSSQGIAPVPQGPVIAEWRSSQRGRLRFGALTGDYNPLHLWNWYARLFGFRAAFHHPPGIVGSVLSRLRPPASAIQRLDLWLKGPVFYGSALHLAGSGLQDGVCFALSPDAVQRPCIIGRWQGQGSMITPSGLGELAC